MSSNRRGPGWMVPANEADRSFRSGDGTVTMQAVTMSDLAMILSGIVRRQVTDKTGLNGMFDFKLEFAPDDAKPGTATADRPPLLTALQEQLGLKLESARGPVEVMIVDHVERPVEN